MYQIIQRHSLVGCGRGRRSERGQGLVEFSLMVVFLSVLLMGIFDLGRAYFSYLALKDAAQEGAYFGSAFPQCQVQGTANNGCDDPNNIPYRVKHSAPQGSLVNMNDLNALIVVDAPVVAAGQVLTVTVSYQYQLLTPFVGAIVSGQTLTLTARSSAVIVRVPNCTPKPCS
jgi:Flp pilus assembly protein TadG